MSDEDEDQYNEIFDDAINACRAICSEKLDSFESIESMLMGLYLDLVQTQYTLLLELGNDRESQKEIARTVSNALKQYVIELEAYHLH